VEAGFSHLTPAGYEDFLYEVFKEEREISIDKIVIQDAPLAGTPLAKEVTKVVMDLAGLL
jgi:hypothetical protein